MDKEDYELYLLAEMCYIQDHGDIDKEELFDDEWYSNKNYKLKTEILAEAIKNKIDIKDTSKYQNIQEGVKIRNSH